MERYRMGNMPEELVHEILLRLPVKALLVCKSVCKDWCALIKSPGFVNRHFSHESNQESLVFYGVHISVDEDGFREVERDVFLMYDDEGHSLVEAPNHLRQIVAHMITDGLEKGLFCLSIGCSLGLFNPATREFKRLPLIPELHGQECYFSLLIGCGLDPSSGDFKVVALSQNKNCKHAFVYNLSTDSWKTVENKTGHTIEYGIPTLNGVKHWLTKCANSNAYSILAFDMRSEKFQEIAIPDALGKTERSLRITTYCDLVAVISFKWNESIDLWVMGRDGLWSKSFSIGPCQEDFWPQLVWKNNKVFFSRLVSHLIMCDVTTQKVTTLYPMDPQTTFRIPFIYKESLVSIKGEIDESLEDWSISCLSSLLGRLVDGLV